MSATSSTSRGTRPSRKYHALVTIRVLSLSLSSFRNAGVSSRTGLHFHFSFQNTRVGSISPTSALATLRLVVVDARIWLLSIPTALHSLPVSCTLSVLPLIPCEPSLRESVKPVSVLRKC